MRLLPCSFGFVYQDVFSRSKGGVPAFFDQLFGQLKKEKSGSSTLPGAGVF
jgi:hypothetical protein